ncbi:MAG: FHA domain-containing protein, partial [Acidobacteriota bacterium]
ISRLPPRVIPSTPEPPPSAGPLPAPGAPTHLLFRGQAYPLTDSPLILGREMPQEQRGLRLPGQGSGLSPIHCSIRRTKGSVQVQVHNRSDTFLNGKRVQGAFQVETGDRLRLGNPGVELLLIQVVQ